MERGGRIKKIAFWRIKEICKNIVVFKIAFLGKKIRQKFIFYAKNTLKNAKNQKIFAKNIFGETHMKFLAEFLAKSGGHFMRSKNFKGSKCVKMKLNKSEEVVRTFDNIQTAYAQILDKDENIQKIQCNVPLEGIEDGEFTTDFVCTKTDGDILVKECVFRKKLSLPRTCKLLDVSRDYWLKRGVTDWGIVIEEEEKENAEE